MATAFVLPASRHTLMHASLASLTPELLTLDALIHAPPTPSSRSSSRPALPTELLLLIRSHLLPMQTASLLDASAHALAAYERALLALLCPDCASYNSDVYGPDLWAWPADRLAGPCACRNSSSSAQNTTTMTAPEARMCAFDDAMAEIFSASWEGRSDTNRLCERYVDAASFVELYLSRHARRLARLAFKEELAASRRNRSPSPSSSSSSISSRAREFLGVRSVWDVVSLVLRDQHACAAFTLDASASQVPSQVRGVAAAPSEGGACQADQQQREVGAVKEVDEEVFRACYAPVQTSIGSECGSGGCHGASAVCLGKVPVGMASTSSTSTSNTTNTNSNANGRRGHTRSASSSPFSFSPRFGHQHAETVYISPLALEADARGDIEDESITRSGEHATSVALHAAAAPAPSCSSSSGPLISEGESLSLPASSAVVAGVAAEGVETAVTAEQQQQQQSPCYADPWVSRAQLARVRRDLGLALDYNRPRQHKHDRTTGSFPAASFAGAGKGAAGRAEAGAATPAAGEAGEGEGGAAEADSVEPTRDSDMRRRPEARAPRTAALSSSSSSSSSSPSYARLLALRAMVLMGPASLLSAIRVLAALAAACLCLPLALPRLALTLVCFYARPRSLRVL